MDNNILPIQKDKATEDLAKLADDQKKKKEAQPLIVVMPGTNKAYFNPFRL